MPPEFLNSREDAILVWGTLITAFVVCKKPREIAAACASLLRAFLHPKLLLLYGSVLAYSGLAVYAAAALDLWHVPALKTTVYWFLGVAFVLAGDAVSRVRDSAQDLALRTLKRVVAVTVIVECVVNLYAFPLAVELIGVFVAALFGGMQIIAQRDPSVDDRARSFIGGVLTTGGLVYIGYSLVRVLSDLDGFLTGERMEELLVPISLTVALLPFLLTVAWLSRLEQERLRRRWRLSSDARA